MKPNLGTMRIEKRTMGWIQKPSAWEYQESLNAKRKEQAQAHLDQQSTLAGAIFTATDTFSYDMTELALKAVVNRVTTEAEERAKAALPDELLSQLSSTLDKTA
jgi:hypothetical protein